MTRRSTDRPARSVAAIDRPSSIVSGVRTTSQSSRTPRAAASTGSRARARSSQATIAPSTCASAANRRARVVLPELASPRNATLALRGRPPGPRIASSVGKPVRTIRSTPWPPGSGGSGCSGRSSGSASSGSASSGSGTVASAPMTRGPVDRSPAIRGAAAPQRAWRDARAADTSGESAAIGPTIERMFYIFNPLRSSRASSIVRDRGLRLPWRASGPRGPEHPLGWTGASARRLRSCQMLRLVALSRLRACPSESDASPGPIHGRILPKCHVSSAYDKNLARPRPRPVDNATHESIRQIRPTTGTHYSEGPRS
jgi:hypothetical protein